MVNKFKLYQSRSEDAKVHSYFTVSHFEDEVGYQPLDEFFRQNGRTAIAKRLRTMELGEKA